VRADFEDECASRVGQGTSGHGASGEVEEASEMEESRVWGGVGCL